jgi:hydroxymethylbilane synthase
VKQTLKIGTRGSPLALTQARMVQAALQGAHAGLSAEIVVIQTSGDWIPAQGEVRLSASAGGKGQFAKEIEAALLEGAVDIGVHSMKDMDSRLPAGLVIKHMLKREDVRDALILHPDLKGKVKSIQDIPAGTAVGTASVRRRAVLLAARPDLKVVPFRGNVGTRLEKLRDGQVQVTLLAMAGLNRLGLSQEADVIIPPEEMLPCAGQGAVGIECRQDRLVGLSRFLDSISDLNTVLCVSAERAALAALDGSCHTPIGALARLAADGTMSLSLQVTALDGGQSFEHVDRNVVGTLEEAESFGKSTGLALKNKMPEGFLTQVIT